MGKCFAPLIQADAIYGVVRPHLPPQMGSVRIPVGASEGETGGYYGFEYTVVWRPFGAILVAFGLLIGPVAAIGCRTVALVARERAESLRPS